MKNFFFIAFLSYSDFSGYIGTYNEADFFGITEAYNLCEVPNTPSLQIINGFLSEEDALYIYDYDK